MLRWPNERDWLQANGCRGGAIAEYCEAYELACEALAYWAKGRLPNSAGLASEYRSLVGELEREIDLIRQQNGALEHR